MFDQPLLCEIVCAISRHFSTYLQKVVSFLEDRHAVNISIQNVSVLGSRQTANINTPSHHNDISTQNVSVLEARERNSQRHAVYTQVIISQQS